MRTSGSRVADGELTWREPWLNGRQPGKVSHPARSLQVSASAAMSECAAWLHQRGLNLRQQLERLYERCDVRPPHRHAVALGSIIWLLTSLRPCHIKLDVAAPRRYGFFVENNGYFFCYEQVRFALPAFPDGHIECRFCRDSAAAGSVPPLMTGLCPSLLSTQSSHDSAHLLMDPT